MKTLVMPSGGAFWHTKLAIPAALLVVILGSAALYLTGICPARFGFYHDDSLYVVTAKAVAHGEGYRIPSLPQSPSQTKYPPFYPLVLALVWKICPHFPQNLTPMIYVSVSLVLFFHLSTWGYLRVRRHTSSWQTAAIVALLSFNFREMILATSLLSEPLYALLSIAVLWLSEAYLQSRRRGIGFLLSLSLVLAVLTRSSGIALLIALTLHLRRERIMRSRFLILGPPILAFGLWVGWCSITGANTRTIPGISYYTSYFQDWVQMLSDFARQIGQPAVIMLPLLVFKNLIMLVIASTSVVLMGLSYQRLPTLAGFPIGLLSIIVGFLSLLVGFSNQRRTHPGIVHTYVITYISLHIIWPYTAYDRFLMPVLPFLLMYFLRGISDIGEAFTQGTGSGSSRVRRIRATWAAAVVLMGLLFIGINYVAGVRQLRAENEEYVRRFRECDVPIFSWLCRNTRPSDVLICYHDAKYFLYTGRSAVRTAYGAGGECPSGSLEETARSVGAAYLILTSSDFTLGSRPEAARAALRSYVLTQPETFAKVYENYSCGGSIFSIQRAK